MADLAHAAPGRPDVPGVLRRRQRAARPPRPRGDDRGDPPSRAARARPAAFGRFCDWLERALPRRDAELHRRATTTRRSTSLRPLAPGARRCCASAASAGSARSVGALLRRRAAAAPLQLPGDVRRAGAVRGARPLRRHHLHGHGRRRLRPRRRHARRCRRRSPPRRRARPASTFRYDTRGRADPARATAPAARCAASRLAGGERHRRRRRRVQPRPAGRLPHAAARPRRAACGPPRHVLAVAPWCGTPACAATCRPASPTTTSTSAASGTRRSTRCIDDGARMPDPSILVTRADRSTTPSLAPARPPRALRPRAGAQPRRPRSTGRAERAPVARRPASAGRPRSATRPTSRSRSSSTRSTGRRQGMERGTPFALAHRFLQTGPFRPGNVERRGARPGVRRLAARCPASACRWCWCPGRLAAERVADAWRR